MGSSLGGSHLPRNQCLGETGQVTFSEDVFHLADLVEAPDIKGVTRNRMLLQVGLEFLDVLEGDDTWRTGSSIEPMLNNDGTSGQRILYLRKACLRQNLGSFLSPVVWRVAIGNSFHRILCEVIFLDYAKSSPP